MFEDKESTKVGMMYLKKSDKESKRTPNAVEWNGTRFTRVELDGEISLVEYLDKPVVVAPLQRCAEGDVDNDVGAERGGDA